MVMEVGTPVPTFSDHLLTRHVVADIPEWPSYANETKNFVFRKDQSYIELDNDRAEGVAYINILVR